LLCPPYEIVIKKNKKKTPSPSPFPEAGIEEELVFPCHLQVQGRELVRLVWPRLSLHTGTGNRRVWLGIRTLGTMTVV